MFCEYEQSWGPDGKLLCLVCDQCHAKRTVYMPPKEMRKHVAAHNLSMQILPNACILRRLWHPPPPSFAKATGMQAGNQCFSG
jgi:hypothetical protein